MNVSLERGQQGGASSGVRAAHFPAQHAIAGNRSTSHVGGGNDPTPEETAVFPGETEILNKRTVSEAGIEPARRLPGKTTIPDPGGTKSGALPADLAHVIKAWGSLTADDRRRIRAIADGQRASGG